MGDYTSVGLVRSATGVSESTLSSGVIHFCVSRGEAVLKKYLGFTPASGSELEEWVQSAATDFASYFVMQRLASEHAPLYYYARDLSIDRGAEFRGRSMMAEAFWQAAIRTCNMHGRKVKFERATASNSTAEAAEG